MSGNEELVKRLRGISNSDSNIKSNYIGLTMIQAADAIEKLSKRVPPVPHGRLIDADALLDGLLFPSKQFEQGMRELLGDAPTIIPAEPPKEEAPTGPYDLLYEEGGPNTT